ncbi:MAG: glycerophosphodiester phosphodiesterase [Chthonomonadaceae bacterium]|nr:glycerophosphodiester phosphodiesterase [Chthonomonadaceae bacterium]
MMKARNVPHWLLAKPIAHRGLHDRSGAPENSLAAFHAAIRVGLPIELDVHLLADDRPVVFHDHDLLRLTGVTGKIEEQDAQSIRDLRLLQTEQGIPLFTEVLREVDGAVPLLIEIKSGHPAVGALERAVLQDLQDYRGAFAVQSFNPMSVHYFKENAPSVCCGQLSGSNVGVPFARLNQPDFVAYYVDSLTRRRTLRLRRYGAPLLAWTVSSAAQYKRAKSFADNYIFDTTPDFTLPGLPPRDGQ